MKKRVLLGMMLCLVMAAGTARAEHKLLVTEILDAKQMEAQAKFEYTHLTRDLKAAVESGKVTSNLLESNYSLGVGLGHGLEVTASIPYVMSERTKVELNGLEPEYEKRDGVGDFSFGGKYRLFDEEKEPFSLVAGLDMKFDTAGGGNAGTQTTDVSPYLAASKKLNPHFIPYGIYRATLRNNGGEDTHTVTAGAEAELNETVTLDARLDANFGTGTKLSTASEVYSFELASYLQLLHNFYLIPSVAVASGSPVDAKGVDARLDTPFAIRGGMSLYYLF